MLFAALAVLAALAPAFAGPFLVKNIDNGTRDAWPMDLTAANGLVFFTVPLAGPTGYLTASALWRSDGTAAGSMPLLRSEWGEITPLATAGNRFFAFRNDGMIVASDGTPAGTAELARIPGYELGHVTMRDLLFLVMGRWDSGPSLLVSDGTAAGTRPALDLSFGPTWQRPMLVVAGEHVFVSSYGTATGPELWVTDATDAGTTRVAALGAGTSFASMIVPVDDHVFFTATDADGRRALWTSDGTAAGTAALAPLDVSASTTVNVIVPTAGGVYIVIHSAPPALWISDGTADGTRRLAELPNDAPRDAVELDGRLFFTAADAGGALSLWSSDGTTNGTARLTALGPAGVPDGATAFEHVNGLLFAATCVRSSLDDDDTYPYNQHRTCELWRSDGTPTGTFRVAVFDPGMGEDDEDHRIANDVSLARVGDRLVFGAADGDRLGLASSDGTAGGTVQLARFTTDPRSPLHFVVHDGFLLFDAADDETGDELWRTDGTLAGTRQVADINPGRSGSWPAFLTNVGGVTFFTARDQTAGDELWRTDGTAAGTGRVLDIDTRGTGSNPTRLTKVGDTLFFAAADRAGGTELWRSDGTEGGTLQVRDLYPGPLGWAPTQMLDVGGRLVFVSASGALWRSDGTWDGTVPLASPQPEPGTSRTIANIGGRVFVLVHPPFLSVDRVALWASDGATEEVQEIATWTNEGRCWWVPDRILDVDGVALFFAPSPAGQNSLYRSDGTPQGTVMVRELGGCAGEAHMLGAGGGNVYFLSADSHLWRSDGTAQGTVDVSAIFWPGTIGVVDDTVAFPRGADVWRSDPPNVSRIGGLYGYYVQMLTALGHRLLVAGSPWFDSGPYRLFTADPFARTIVPLGDVPRVSGPIAGAGAAAYFAAGGEDPAFGEELWTTDGTAAGTGRLSDIEPGPVGSAPREMTRVGNLLFFSAGDEVHGRQLWALSLDDDGRPREPLHGCEPPGCDDGDACTADWCDDDRGCVHVVRAGCGTTTTTVPTTTLPPSTTTTVAPPGPSTSTTTPSPTTSTITSSTTSSTEHVVSTTTSLQPPLVTTTTLARAPSCDDGDPCTRDRASDGRCRHERLATFACVVVHGRLEIPSCDRDHLPAALVRRLKRTAALLARIEAARAGRRDAHIEPAARRSLVKAARLVRTTGPHGITGVCADAVRSMIAAGEDALRGR